MQLVITIIMVSYEMRARSFTRSLDHVEQFLSFLPNSFVCASSTGALSIYSIDSRPSADSAFAEWILQLDSQHEQPALRHQGSATALTVDQTNHTIATVGEDGFVHVFHPENETATKCASSRCRHLLCF